MFLIKFRLKHFRNYGEEEFEFAPGINLIWGENGQGKTNLLEAVHLLCAAHSPRTRKDRELTHWEEKSFTLFMEAQRAEERHIQSMECIASGERRIRINNEERKNLSDLIGHIPAIALGPDDIELTTGSPADRRRFFDSLLCQYSTEYLRVLREYNRALKQRNSLLRQSERFDRRSLEIFTAQICDAGARVTEMRLRFVNSYSVKASEFYKQISNERETFTVRWKCQFSQATTFPDLKTDLFTRLGESAASEIASQTTLAGPHRDDLTLLLSGKAVRDYASQGQKRSCALSLKLAAAQSLNDRNHQSPILLVDDVFAELDDSRRSRLSELMAVSGQVLIATPRPSDIPFKAGKAFRIHAGKVIERS